MGAKGHSQTHRCLRCHDEVIRNEVVVYRVKMACVCVVLLALIAAVVGVALTVYNDPF